MKKYTATYTTTVVTKVEFDGPDDAYAREFAAEMRWVLDAYESGSFKERVELSSITVGRKRVYPAKPVTRTLLVGARIRRRE